MRAKSMSTTTALSLEHIDKAVEVVVRRQPLSRPQRAPTPRLLRQFVRLTAVIAFAPLALVIVSALLLVLVAKLLFSLVALAFEA
jgi:hypothetical protein